MAALKFSSKGYSVMEMEGGFKAWEEHNMEVEGPNGFQIRKITALAAIRATMII